MRGALLAVLIGSVVCTAACGNAATAPSGQPAPFFEGAYLVEFVGGSIECNDIKNPPAGTRLTTRVMASYSGDTWVATSLTPFDGALEIRLRRTTVPSASGSGLYNPLFGYYVSGTISGFANNSWDVAQRVLTSEVFYARINTLTINQASATSGSTGGPVTGQIYADGKISNQVVFSYQGVSSTCPPGQVAWTLNGPTKF